VGPAARTGGIFGVFESNWPKPAAAFLVVDRLRFGGHGADGRRVFLDSAGAPPMCGPPTAKDADRRQGGRTTPPWRLFIAQPFRSERGADFSVD